MSSLTFPLTFPLTAGDHPTASLTSWLQLQRYYFSFLPSPSFALPLNDAGAGAVNLNPIFNAGSGTATFTRATVAWTKLSTGLWAQVASGTARSAYLGADTTVGAYGGYFAEGAAIQLVTPTASIRDMTQAAFNVVTAAAARSR